MIEKANLEEIVTKKNFRTCRKGHQYFKTSDCPTCPVCEKEKKPKDGFLTLLGAPARRALEANGIKTLKKLSTFSEKEILQFHGIGKTSIPILKNALQKEGFTFKKGA